ncbi:hypothetical protein ABZZ79_15020 [Streptomyces sp. NPDC006458]|uniref:hypothetical protein n=1 Tax=Streptomyces sp. NPDC006458 TaxID=3154302 RepID=UPI0033B707AB
MAHAAPVPVGVNAAGLPDVFSARTHKIMHWALPVTLGLIYGYWVAANNRAGGEITGWNILLGFVSTVAFAVLWIAVRAVASGLPRELHAVLWAAFSGCAFGFLYAQTGESIVRSVVMSLVVSASVFAVLFYRYYTHEDAEGHRIS